MDPVKVTRQLLGSIFEVTLILPSMQERSRAHPILEQAFGQAKAFEERYSRFHEGNILAALNARVGEWVEVSEELYALLKFGVRLSEETGGAFNLTVKSILEGWGYDAHYSLNEGLPGQTGVIELQDSPCRVYATAPLELGGLGKGYILDRIVESLKGFSNFCVNAGGDLWAQGVNERGEPWKALFEHPTDPTQAIGWVEVDGFALACSSPSRRRWRNRHHLVDARVKAPANAMLAVYTQTKTGFLADAYSTALFVMGFEAARSAVERFPVQAMLVSPRGEIYRTPCFRGELFTVK